MAGGLSGAAVLAAFVAFGLMLGGRVANPIPLIVLTIAGAYGGWLMGVVVFGAVRGGDEPEESR
ncbi:MAG TPA: hypothetical protein VGG31_03250 [Candidatus Dormibacteraeota bacterium]